MDPLPDGAERAIHSEAPDRSRPDLAALAASGQHGEGDLTDLFLPLISWAYEQDLVMRCVRAIAEVGPVRSDLKSKASCEFTASVPLQVDQHLAIGCQEPAPPVRDRPPVLRVRVAAPHTMLADSVVQTLVGNSAGSRS